MGRVCSPGWLFPLFARGLLTLVVLLLASVALPANARLDAGAAAPGAPAPIRWLTPQDHALFRALIAADQRTLEATGAGFAAWLAEQQLRVAFSADGVAVAPAAGGWRWAVRAERLARGGAWAPLAAAAPVGAGPTVRYERRLLTEWYRLRAEGLEQGFTLPERPLGEDAGAAGGEPLRLMLRVEGGLVPATEGPRGLVWRDTEGAAVLAYRGLRAWDATGRELEAWLEAGGDTLALAVADAGATYPLVIDPLVQQAKLTANDGAAGDEFGTGVALSSDGNTALVGAPFATVGLNSGQGAAYVFVRSGTTWTPQAKLTASDGAASDLFGTSVALSADGNTALVGAPFADGAQANQGAAYVYVRSGVTWSPQAKLTASDGVAQDQFGGSVALSSDGNTALAGAPLASIGSNSSQGAAYVFVRSGTTWSPQAKLTASDGAASDLFGTSVALSADGNTALVGAPFADGTQTDQGAAYVYVRSGVTWSPQAKLTASDGVAQDQFGTSVGLSSDGNTALVGAPAASGTQANQGAAYVFVRSGGTWTPQAKLTASDGQTGDEFGTSVALSGNGTTALVGARFAAVGLNPSQGAAYVFARSGGTWLPQQKLTAADGAPSDEFGSSVALPNDGTTALVGAPFAAVSSNPAQGAAYVFATPTATSTATPTSTSTPTPTATPTHTPTATLTPSLTPTNPPTLTATATLTPTATATVPPGTATATSTLLATATSTSTATATPSPTPTATPTATATATATALACASVGSVCHASLTPLAPSPAAASGPGGFAAGLLQPGPCLPPGAPDCLQTTGTGSFAVLVTLRGLQPGDQVTLHIPVVNAQGLPVGTREVACPVAPAGGVLTCSGVVREPGVFPRLGGLVEVRVRRAAPSATPVAALAVVPPLLPRPAPAGPLLPPPAPLLPPPAALLPPPTGAGPAPFAEVPVIPEAGSLGLLALGLGALGAWALGRPRRRAG